MDAKRRMLWVVLVLLTVVWARYAALMREYPLTSPYPLEELSVRLFWFALVFATLYAAVAVLIIRYGAWTRQVFAAAAVIGVIAFSMAPVRSPDLYWTLDAGRAWMQEGINPYEAGPRVAEGGSWAARAGMVMGMVYGPLWTLLVSAAASAGSLVSALAAMKLIGLLAFAAGLIAVRQLIAASGLPLDRREPLLALVVLNPLLLHAGLVDVSNDILTFAAIAWAMVMTARGHYLPAAALLAVGGLVKYVPWLLIPIPLSLAFLRKKRPSRSHAGIALCALALMVLAYLPFGPAALLGADMRVAYEVFMRPDMAFPVAWLLMKSGVPVFWIQLSGVGAALAALAFCIFKGHWALAWWVPLAVLLVAGGSWVNPWYLLWLLPAAAAAGSAVAVTTIGVAGILMPWVIKSRAMGFALLGGGAWYWRKYKAAR